MSDVKVSIPKTIYVETDEKSFAIEGVFSFPIGEWLWSDDLKEMISIINTKIITLSTKSQEN